MANSIKQFIIAFTSFFSSCEDEYAFNQNSTSKGNKTYTCQEENLITEGHLDHLLGTWIGESQTNTVLGQVSHNIFC